MGDITGDVTSDRDTFVSVDVYNAANNTSSSLHPQNNPDPDHTATLDEFLADEDILADDLVPTNQTSQTSLPRMSQAINANRQDSSFIWAVHTPVGDMHHHHSDPAEDDQLDGQIDGQSPVADDPGDITNTLEATSTPSDRDRREHSVDPDQTPHSVSSQSTRRSSLPSSSSRRSPNSDDATPGDNSADHNRRVSMPSNALQQSTNAHPHEYATPGDTTYPPPHTTEALLSHDDTQCEFDDDKDDTKYSMRSGSSRHNHNGSSVMDRRQQLKVAADGYESVEVQNPFFNAEEAGATPSTLVLFSKQGPFPLEEKMALQDFASLQGTVQARLLRRFIETVLFQRHMLTTVKDNEVNLFNSQLNGELRRYSALERERVFAIDALVEELDDERNQMLSIQRENEDLKLKLKEAERKNAEVEKYYSRFMSEFKLGDEVIPALERANNGVEQFRRESAQIAEKKDVEIEDYARRLLKMEDIVAQSRKRVEQVEAENHELRVQVNMTEVRGQSSDEAAIETPMKKVFASPAKEAEKRDLLQTVNEQQFQIDNLRKLNEKAEEDRRKVHEAFLSMNVNMESAQSRVATLQSQRDAAEAKCHELYNKASEEKQKFVAFSSEMSKNIVQVVNELDLKESELRSLRSEMEDRESALRSLQCTIKDLEDQLQAFTDTALERSRQRNNDDAQTVSHPLVDTIISSLRDDLNRAQDLLSEKAMELDDVKRDLHEQGEEIIALQKDRARLEAACAVRRRSLVSSPQISENASEEEAKFLQRLSVKLGCHSNNNRQLVSQLSERIEKLMVQRSEFVNANQVLKSEVSDRERALHSLRSEMQAEISSLKAEATHLENLKNLAQEERKNAEDRILQILNEPDITRRESLADLTVSSVGTRAWALGDEGDQTRRGSITDANADRTISWTDPVIAAAVESVSNLIGTKDNLAARNRELREKLQNLINSLPADDEGASGSRSVMIQSKELHEELAGIVGLQQGIIERLGMAQAENHDEETLPYMRKSSEVALDPTVDMSSRDLGAHTLDGSGEATRFLNDQLAETRKLFSQKLKANVELCGVIDELKEELIQFKSANHNMETALEKLKDTHQGFLTRLSDMTGVSASVVALEDFVRIILTDTMTLRKDMERKEQDELSLSKRVSSLIVQKRILSYMIFLYQNKYKLNLLASSGTESTIRQRLRIRLFAVLALTKISNAAKTVPEELSLSDVSKDYDVPSVVDITCPASDCVPLMDASLALAAVPRLETAITDKENQILRLESSLDALNRSAAALGAESMQNAQNDVPQSAFVYTEDMINRKKDLSRRLQKIISEKEVLESELSREKQTRLTVEAKVAKYMEKVAAYKRKLGKVASHAEARENAYKEAIRYLKSKADKAVANNMDENIAPWEAKVTKPDNTASNERNATSRAALGDTLRQARAELAGMEPGSAAFKEKEKYVEGLKRTLQLLEHAMLFNRRDPRPSQENVTRGALPG